MDRADIEGMAARAVQLYLFIGGHSGCRLVALLDNNRMLVESELILKNGVSCDYVESIPATWQGIREWLGY
jgi:hypothetical protein